ncbi:hypothetical protein CCM_04082 [Cordyceps militaris CM01]|uniref:Uncharacterized protein n=1 Tax=Cordyceps militaris (strain CM01) TaxID=983644 RepID=G3JDN4_CORMM|nr:uncharacterized protein CCM_04082 [Cordyceps militaris CM01]EGX92709.1 hypothetical protein CCM_04082 [Cordyceps militaris CM01]
MICQFTHDPEKDGRDDHLSAVEMRKSVHKSAEAVDPPFPSLRPAIKAQRPWDRDTPA